MGVNIYIWNRLVGALVHSPEGMAFQYDDDFKKSNLNLSPLNLPLTGKDVYIQEPDWKGTEGIPGLVYDSLPDKFGTNLLEIYFAEKGLAAKDIDVFSKLQYIGKRGMGALEFQPADKTDQLNNVISIEAIEKISLLASRGKEALQPNLKDKKALLQILHMGTSAGGARTKALIAINKKNGDIRSGQLQQGPQFEYFIIKIDGANQKELAEPGGFGRLEYTYAQMARESGLQMSECSLYNDLHFVTKRFDRNSQGEKIHVHSLCGLMGLDYNLVGTYSYEQYFMAARRLGLGNDSMEEIYRRMVFNVLVHNCDDHPKNFSFMMDQTGKWSLSPAFDICYFYDSANEWVSGHNMRVNNKRTDINYQDLMAVGEKLNIKKRRMIFEKLKSVVDKFPEYAKNNKVKKELVAEVEKNRPRINGPGK